MSKQTLSKKLKQTVAERANHCCEYCLSQARFATQAFSVEHIKPLSQGGSLLSLDNLALACQGCNAHKYTKTEAYDPVTQQIANLYHPRQQRWCEHFQWNCDFSLVIGISPTGRATVDALHLNRDGLVNLRRILYQAGNYPS
jgi:hypothetical protein